MLALVAPVLAGCAGASDMLSRDADWFSRPGRVFIKNVSIETPPLTPDKPVTPQDLISADGMCPGMAPPPGPEGAAPNDPAAAPSQGGTVALGHTECDVARGLGVPSNVALSTNERGQRVATLTYNGGARAGIYTFTGGRLTSIDRGADPVVEKKPVRAKRKKNAS
ncbi:hypothetical protein [Rhodopseudomonas sp. B29]|uniref:hypothetical protein n=1 Tax=Rhodopseudomonas sp. B29 TaxID=95607 RepID=UPI001900F562|nr:hypothetical protein [Rhodopseudomonas sp. B29]